MDNPQPTPYEVAGNTYVNPEWLHAKAEELHQQQAELITDDLEEWDDMLKLASGLAALATALEQSVHRAIAADLEPGEKIASTENIYSMTKHSKRTTINTAVVETEYPYAEDPYLYKPNPSLDTKQVRAHFPPAKFPNFYNTTTTESKPKVKPLTVRSRKD